MEWSVPRPSRVIPRREEFLSFEEAWVRARGLRGNGPPRLLVTGIRLLRIRSTCTALIDRPVPNGVECTYRKEACGRAAQGGKCDRHGGDRG